MHHDDKETTSHGARIRLVVTRAGPLVDDLTMTPHRATLGELRFLCEATAPSHNRAPLHKGHTASGAQSKLSSMTTATWQRTTQLQ